MKENSYVIVLGIPFRRNFDGVFLRCFPTKKVHEILKEMHEVACGGYFSPRVTTHHIIRVGYYWPTIFKDSYALIRNFPTCQNFLGRMKRASIPLQPFLVYIPSMQWGLDVIGPINPKSS